VLHSVVPIVYGSSTVSQHHSLFQSASASGLGESIATSYPGRNATLVRFRSVIHDIARCRERLCRRFIGLLAFGYLLATGLAVGQPIERASVHNVDGSFVREWLVLGPFPSGDLETDFLESVGGEANVRPREGDTFTTKDGKQLVWTRLRSSRDVVELVQVFGIQEWTFAYVYCELNSDASIETDVRAMSSQLAPVWLNGKKIGQTSGRRYRRTDSTPILPIRLNAGRNSCLLKLKVESSHDWSFSFQPLPAGRASVELQVTEPPGGPVADAVIQIYDQNELVERLPTQLEGYAKTSLYPLAESYDVRVTAGNRGTWLHALSFRAGERRQLQVVLTNAVSISGHVLAMDGSPQTAIVVQALRVSESSSTNALDLPVRPRLPDVTSEPRINATNHTSVRSLLPMPAFSETVLSDTNGSFRFINLRPGQYRLRAHGSRGFVYPDGEEGTAIRVEAGKTHDGPSFTFPEAKKGVWNRYPIKQGLADLQSGSILRTPDGMLWVGTHQGTLHAYDGVEFKLFASPQSSANPFRAIKYDVNGTIWIGTDMGISRMMDGRIQNSPFNDSLPGKSVTSIEPDPDGSVWFGTASGLCRFDGRQFVRWTPKEGAPSYEIDAVLRGRDGGLWMSTHHSLARFDGRNFSEPVLLSGVRHLTVEEKPTVEKLYEARDGAIWFCSPESEIAAYRYDGQTLCRLGEKEGLPNHQIYTITETSDGILWLGTDKGLSRFDGTNILHYTTADGLSGEEVRDIFVDSDDVLWCACDMGISRFDPKGFSRIGTRDGLTNRTSKIPGVFAIEPATEGGYLIGTEWGGVYHLDDQIRLLSTNSNFLLRAYVRHIQRAADGASWFGTADGIYRLVDGGAAKVLDRSWIIALNSGSPGELWFGQGWIGGGVSRYNLKTGEQTVFTRAQGLPGDGVWALERGLDGSMWIGTSGGLARFRDGKIENIGEKLGMPAARVMSLRQEADDTLWIGSGAGLHRLRGTNLVSVTPINDISINAVWCSARAADGITWVGTDRSALLGFDSQTLTMIDKRDGLLGDQVFTVRPEHDNSLLMGFVDGGLSRYRRTKTHPSVRLVDVKMEDRSFSEFAKLPATEIGKRVSVQYQEIDLKTHPEKRQFRYRVEGPSGEMLFGGITKDRRFEWTPKKGGAYTFEVQTIDRDLNYSKPARLTFRATVPWYANVWIIVPGGAGIVALSIGGLVAVALYRRKSREAGLWQERVRIARDLHDNLGAGLTHLAMVSDQVRHQADQPRAVEMLAGRLTDSARELTRTMGEIIWMTDPAKGTLRSFVAFFTSYAERFFVGSPIRLRFEIPAEIADVTLPEELRRSLFLVMKEALNNVAKHAQASEIRIGLEVREQELHVSVEDDGRGFSKTTVGADRRGLVNMQQRLRDLGGEMQIESVVDQGTRVVARVPLVMTKF
jgi:ligand-binding sensor domain-containing protein/two-component sensor histidine kinase